MKSIKVKNLSQFLLILKSGEGQVTLEAGKTKSFSEHDYIVVAKTCESFNSSKMVEITYEDTKTVSADGSSIAEINPEASKLLDAKAEIKAKLAELQKEFKTAHKARKEQIALEVEALKEDAKKLK